MPRDADISTRVNRSASETEVQNTPLVVAAQPITEHNSIQGDKTSQMADQLTEALGVGGKVAGGIFQKQQAADTAQGQEDAQTGVTKDNPSAAYSAAQDHVHALASWAVDGDQIGMQAQKMGFDQNPDAKQGLADMNTWLNGQYAQLYNGSSKQTMDTLTPKMAELRDNLNSWFTKSAAAQVVAKNQADIKTITGSAFSKAFTPDPTLEDNGGTFDPTKFDYNGINKNTQSIFPGADGNKLMLAQLSELAKTKGVPNLLTGMPDRWADGTPTPKGSGDPETIKAYESAVKEATTQQSLNLGAADAYNRDAHKEVVKASEMSIMNNVLGGRDVTAALHQYATMAGADPKFLESAANWQHERFKQGQEDAVDGGQVASIQKDVATGVITSASQLSARLDQANVQGAARVQATTKLLGNLKEVQSTTADSPELKAYQSYLESKYKPTTDAMGKFDHPAAAQQQADLLLDFRRQAMAPNADVKTIFDNVQKKYGDPIDADKSNPSQPLTPVNDKERAAIITKRNGSQFNSTAFNASGMTAADVSRLAKSGLISDDDAQQAAKAILARHNR